VKLFENKTYTKVLSSAFRRQIVVKYYPEFITQMSVFAKHMPPEGCAQNFGKDFPEAFICLRLFDEVCDNLFLQFQFKQFKKH